MKDIEREQALIRQYLLGELDEERIQQLEQRLITDSDFKREILMTEEDLLQEFVSGELTEADRSRLLKRYLASPRQRRKLEVAQALGRYIGTHKPAETTGAVSPIGRRRSWFDFFRLDNRTGRFVWAAVILLIIVAGGALIWRLGPQDQVARLNDRDSVVLTASPDVLVVELAPVVLRGSAAKPVKVDPAVRIVQIRTPIAPSDSKYRAVLRDADGKDVVRLNEVPVRNLSSGSTIVLQIPSTLLTPGNYELELTQPGDNSQVPTFYSFQVQR
jgi:hypothetical protein